MRLVTVDKVLRSGSYGGAIFNGITEDATKYRLVASSSTMPRPPVAGETWLIEGVMRKHPKHGPYVQANHATLKRPSGRLLVNAIAKSKSFPGIGQTWAQRLWDEFGENLYRLLNTGEAAPFIDLLGSELAELLVKGWRTIAFETDVYSWLDKHGIPVGLANKLISIYGDNILESLENNPYRLLAFTSWGQADTLARSMGIDIQDERRLVAAVDAAVYRRLKSAHTWTDRDVFTESIGTILGCPPAAVESALDKAIIENSVLEVAGGIQGLGPVSMERYVAGRVCEILSGQYEAAQMTFRTLPDDDFLTSFFNDYHKKFRLNLNENQRKAVHLALTSPSGMICGGAGVGKTTVLHAIIEAAKPLNAQVHMMALSGRAARRMSEATGHPAMTITAFLKAIDSGMIDLDCEPTLAIDESSMVDLATMYRILRRIKPGCKLLMIGDPGQLPPIGFGVVFHCFFETEFMPRVELTEIHRQAAGTGIPLVSQDVRNGRIPDLSSYAGKGLGVSFIECQKGKIPDTVLDVVYEIGGFDEVQIISPVKIGPAGTRAINHLCHEMLSPGKPMYGGFSQSEPVIWLVNNYELGLMNGSLGKIASAENNLTVIWDEGKMQIEDTRDMDLAYAITVHKAQGSQFSRVVVPVFGSRLLDRTLIYTAITRAQHQVVLVGDRKAFERSVIEQPDTNRRQTALLNHLKQSSE